MKGLKSVLEWTLAGLLVIGAAFTIWLLMQPPHVERADYGDAVCFVTRAGISCVVKTNYI